MAFLIIFPVIIFVFGIILVLAGGSIWADSCNINDRAGALGVGLLGLTLAAVSVGIVNTIFTNLT